MLEQIINMLKITESDSEYIKIAQGRNEYPESWGELKSNYKLGAFSRKNKIK